MKGKFKSTLSKVEKKVQKTFNEFIRLRDIIKTEDGSLIAKCISCNKTWLLNTPSDWKNYHASHYFLENKYQSVRYDEVNVNGACSYCNRFLHGNLAEYEIGLVKKVGIDRVEHLKIRRNFLKKYDMIELEELNNLYLEKIKVQKLRLGIK